MKKIALYIVIGIGALAVIGGAGALAAYVAVGALANDPGVTHAAPNGNQTAIYASPVAITAANTIPLKAFVTNLTDDGGRTSYINVTFELVVKDEKVKKKVEEQVPAVRDAVLRILNARKSVEVTGPEGANKLKSDIMAAVNQALGAPLVQHVLITDIVVQF